VHTQNVSEEQVAQLGSEELILAHYQDEFRLNELLALADQSVELVSRWTGLPDPERRRFLQQREAVLKHGDRLAATDASSPLLREDLRQAQLAWRGVRENLKSLS